jgi:hypothetical protein
MSAAQQRDFIELGWVEPVEGLVLMCSQQAFLSDGLTNVAVLRRESV